MIHVKLTAFDQQTMEMLQLALWRWDFSLKLRFVVNLYHLGKEKHCRVQPIVRCKYVKAKDCRES